MLSHLVITSSAKTWIRRTVIKISGCSTQKINRLLSSILQKIYLSNSFFRIKVFRAMKIRGKCRIGRVNMKAEKMNETSISSFLYMKNSFFSYFQLGLRSSRSTGVTQAVVLGIFQTFYKIWHTGRPHTSQVEFQGGYLALFCLISLIDICEWFLIGNLYKNIQLMLMFF